MATRTWDGSESGKWDTAANWTPATVPISNDDVIINAGSRSIDDGLDQSAVDLDSMVVGPDYTGEIGNSATAPLQIGCDEMTMNGGGDNHFIKSGAGNAIDILRIKSIGSTGLGAISLEANATIGALIVTKGVVQLFDGTFTDVVLQAFDNVPANATINILDATLTTFWKNRGNATLLSTSASGVVTNAYVGDDTFTVDAGTLTNLWQFRGTTFWTTEDATLTLAKIMGGVFDASLQPAARTITTLESHAGTRINLDTGVVGSITVTNNLQYGGTQEPVLPT